VNCNRKSFIKYCLAAGLGVMYTSLAFSGTGFTENELLDLINRIGNINNDKERVLLLEQVLKLNISDDEKEIIRQVLYVADRWANGFEKYANPGSEGNEGSGYLCGFVEAQMQHLQPLSPQTREDHELFPLIAFYSSRLLVAQMIESGNINHVPELRNKYLSESKRLMKIASASFPANELAKNYLGTYKPWGELVPYNSGAPAWANYQRMVLEKLTWLIHWWVDNRQISDGQFGGGWGDDVEMWRCWLPVLFAFEDEKAQKSQEKLFEGLFRLSRMQKGYTSTMHDVEHTSEEYSDPLFCMLNMQPENPAWVQRTLKVFDFNENLWSGTNDRKQLQFKSTWFNVEKVHSGVNYACDTPYHTRLVKPLMLLWLRTRNQRVGNFVIRWLKTWVEATFTQENGKPEGIVPAAIHWPDGKPSGIGKNWWQPENHTEPTLYYFPNQQSMMYECFLQAYHITKDDYFLKPIRFISEKRLQGIGDGNTGDYQPGSLEWSLSVLKGDIPQILIKYRLITGDKSYDSILRKDATGYERFCLEKDLEQLTKEMDTQRQAFSLPEEFYTSEIRWTDRLFSSVGYINSANNRSIPGFDIGFLFSCLTGSIGNYNILPVFGVKWITHPTEIAILTEVNSTRKFQAQLFHFGNDSRSMRVRFLNLENGNYHWQLSGGKTGFCKINVDNREIEITIPSQKLCKLIVEESH
jgi:hypothetical protein